MENTNQTPLLDQESQYSLPTTLLPGKGLTVDQVSSAHQIAAVRESPEKIVKIPIAGEQRSEWCAWAWV